MTEILRNFDDLQAADRAEDACIELGVSYTLTKTYVVVRGEKDVVMYSLAIHEEQNNDILG